MLMQFDPDEYEMVVESRPCASCGGDLKRCNGMCTGSVMVGQRRRPQEEIDRRRAERERLRDDAILAEAAAIRKKRRGYLGHSEARTTELYCHHHADFMQNARKAWE